MITYDNVSKTYAMNTMAAVSGIHFTLNRGELVSFVGESGSGKSTMLRLAAGLESPDSGEIRIGDQIVAGSENWLPPEKRGVGLVFQGGALFPHLTIGKNIRYGLQQMNRKERRARSREMLELVGLSGFEDRYPHELSGGERQRIALARALAPSPSVVLLDEPFSNLDRALRCRLRDQVTRILREVGASAITVTHDCEDALQIGDRVVIFHQGKIEQVDTPEAIVRNPANDYCAQLLNVTSPSDGSRDP